MTTPEDALSPELRAEMTEVHDGFCCSNTPGGPGLCDRHQTMLESIASGQHGAPIRLGEPVVVHEYLGEVEPPEVNPQTRLIDAFHERTGRCLTGNHLDCARIEQRHREGNHDECLPVEDGATSEQPTYNLATGRWSDGWPQPKRDATSVIRDAFMAGWTAGYNRGVVDADVGSGDAPDEDEAYDAYLAERDA